MILDEIDQHIISLMQKDARMPVNVLAKHIGLSAPGTSERLHKLEERGIIRAFTIEIDPRALGYSLQAIVRIKPLPGKLKSIQQILEKIPELSECDKVTGEDCYIARLHLRSIEHLDYILDKITDYAETNTAIVKSKTVERRLPSFL